MAHFQCKKKKKLNVPNDMSVIKSLTHDNRMKPLIQKVFF